MSEFDFDGAKQSRDDAMERVEAHAAEEWKNLEQDIIFSVCQKQGAFTSEDLWRAGLPKPREPRALGPMLTAAAKKGWCESSGNYVRGSSVTRHGAPIVVWRSKLRYGIEDA